MKKLYIFLLQSSVLVSMQTPWAALSKSNKKNEAGTTIKPSWILGSPIPSPLPSDENKLEKQKLLEIMQLQGEQIKQKNEIINDFQKLLATKDQQLKEKEEELKTLKNIIFDNRPLKNSIAIIQNNLDEIEKTLGLLKK